MNQQYLQTIRDYQARAAVAQPAEESELADLLQRLRNGTMWLTDVNASLLAMPAAGVGTEQEQKFCRSLELWDELEHKLRNAYPDYGPCILGPGQRCPAAAPVRCAACCTPAAGASHT